MAINLSIKKYLLLAAGLLFCGAAKAAETATYTWDFSSAAAVMGELLQVISILPKMQRRGRFLPVPPLTNAVQMYSGKC